MPLGRRRIFAQGANSETRSAATETTATAEKYSAGASSREEDVAILLRTSSAGPPKIACARFYEIASPMYRTRTGKRPTIQGFRGAA